MARLTSTLGKVAALTAKGAAVTLGSAVTSCVAACYIERGANRMVYRYFPHKFAQVEAASGITQEELDAVRVFHSPELKAQGENAEPTAAPAFHSDGRQEARRRQESPASVKESPSYENSNRTLFWIDRRPEDGGNMLSNLVAVRLPRQDVMDCAMTC